MRLRAAFLIPARHLRLSLTLGVSVVAAGSTGALGADLAYPVLAERGVAVASEPGAAECGAAVLRDGGNAFDAAVAIGFYLAVSHPLAGNLGGGGFCVATTAAGEALALDFRETAPAAAHRDLYLDDDGEVVPGLSTRTHRAVGVPGTVDGLLRLHAARGRLSRDRVMEPAVRAAEDGVEVNVFLADALRDKRELLAPWESTREIFFADGEPLPRGARLRQPDLARTLRRIRDHGRAGFYAGPVAEAIVATMEENRGLITADDLRSYEAKWREPLVFERRGYEFVTHPPPSSGGVTLGQILGILAEDDLAALGWQSAAYVRALVDSERLAYADRNHHLGDPDFVEMPVAELLSEGYLTQRRALRPAAGAGTSEAVIAGEPRPPVEGETTHFCVVDEAGNVVAITTTVNGWFGMGAVVPGAGFFLNNEMDDFSAKPGVPNQYGLVGTEANSVRAGKRMLSSMTPTIVRRDGEFFLTAGTPGGSTIITTVLQIFLNVTEFGFNVREAVDAPRFHHQWLPDRVFHERNAISPDTARRLADQGYELEEFRPIGRATAVLRRGDGRLEAWADRRCVGKAVAQ